MRKFHVWATTLLVAVGAGTALVLAQDPVTPEVSSQVAAAAVEHASGLWFVELASPPTADGTSPSTVRAEKVAFRRAAAAAGLRYTERRAFDVLWNGLAVQVSPGQSGLLARIAGVRAVYPIAVIDAPPKPDLATGEEPDMAFALGMTGADVAQNELGLTGAGVRVAVMDTGIDYDHPDFGGCFGTGCRVVAGYDFVGDAFNADPSSPAYNPVAVPDNDPDDCGGHGTHVAGIVGANGTITGVAPAVSLGAYRVFGCEGSTTSDIMLAAMERVLADRMHVLNMSIGASFQWPQYPTAIAATRLVNRGVTVVASIGNSGTSGLYAASAPGVGEKVIGVASFDNVRVTQPAFSISPDGLLVGYQPATGAPPAPTAGSLLMSRTGTQTSTADACLPLPAGSLAGTAALIRRGTCSFYIKANNAQVAGASAVVLYDNAPGILSPTVAGTPAVTIPVVMVTQAQGNLIDTRLAGGAVTLTWTDELGSSPNPTGNLISSFSSYGLAPELSLKPDIGAPGGSIRSTYPLERGGFATLSGTSMASPHTAGAVALLLEARPSTPSQAVRTILQNSAKPRLWWGNPALGFLDNVHRQGAGMLDIPGAILSITRVEPSKLSLGESEAGPVTRSLTVRNTGSDAVTYTLGHAPALATGANSFTPGFLNGPASVAFSMSGAPISSITVPAGGSLSFDVTITANGALPDRAMYGGYVQLTAAGQAPVRVPFAGFKGDYQSIRILTPTANVFPRLLWTLDGVTFGFVAGQRTFTMNGYDQPNVGVHLDHASRQLRIEVFAAVGDKAWHRAFQQDYLPRNSTATGFFAFPFDGVTSAGQKTYVVPNGIYYLRLSVLKALGDPNNPAHWEAWTSPTFEILRPTS